MPYKYITKCYNFPITKILKVSTILIYIFVFSMLSVKLVMSLPFLIRRPGY